MDYYPDSPLEDPADSEPLAGISAELRSTRLAVAEFAKALAVTCINLGTAPGPQFMRECVRLSRELYDEVREATPRPVVESEPEDE